MFTDTLDYEEDHRRRLFDRALSIAKILLFEQRTRPAAYSSLPFTPIQPSRPYSPHPTTVYHPNAGIADILASSCSHKFLALAKHSRDFLTAESEERKW